MRQYLVKLQNLLIGTFLASYANLSFSYSCTASASGPEECGGSYSGYDSSSRGLAIQDALNSCSAGAPSNCICQLDSCSDDSLRETSRNILSPSRAFAAEDEPLSCQPACDKAFACGMVSDPHACVCAAGTPAGSAECSACWTEHSCDELRNYECTRLDGPCN